MDGVTCGMEEFVVIDRIAVAEDKFVLVMLSLKDVRDNNQGGTAYGFVTTGQHWKMLSYDGHCFKRRANLWQYLMGWRKRQRVVDEGMFCYCGLSGCRIDNWRYREEGRCRCPRILLIFYEVCFYKKLKLVCG